jgi:hypothetical protein
MASIQTNPNPVDSYPPPQYSPMTCLYGFLLSILVFFGLMALSIQRPNPGWHRFLVLLQRRATLERIFQTHYWSQDYRTQNASEDYRSSNLRHSRPD